MSTRWTTPDPITPTDKAINHLSDVGFIGARLNFPLPAQSVTLFALPAAPGNRSLVTALLAQPLAGLAPVSVSFNGTGSADPDGSIVSYAWNFGDGATASARRQITASARQEVTSRV